MDIQTILALGVAAIMALEKILNRGHNKKIEDVDKKVTLALQILEVRKEENSITLDASEAAVDAAISLGANGECRKAKQRIVEYRDKCLEQRL